METTHRGLAVCSYKRRSAGAILLVSVPAMINKSACLGVGLNIMPKRSKSYRLTVECIISIAQHANPKVNGHKDPLRAQLTKLVVFTFK
jgi:hypothetical protein